jgi:hypothetical protein
MLARYSHIRSAAKQAAIATLERDDFAPDSPQKSPQSAANGIDGPSPIPEEALN